MAELLTMPKLSDTMEEGGISEWLKKEGDEVSSGDPLVSIETDKATIEYASPVDGTLLKILVQAGSAVPIQTPIAVIGKKAEDFSALLSPKSSKVVTPEEPAKSIPQMKAPEVVVPSSIATTERIKASPLAKKVAAAKGLSLDTLQGSGPQGRIVVRDVPAASSFRVQEDKRMTLSMMRKTIAKRLVQAKNEAPHFYLRVSANVDNLLAWRSKLNGVSEVKEERLPKVSVNDQLIMLVARALRRHPEINASWQGEHILQHGQINMAIAVALPQGLITPVLVDADRLGLREIATRAKALIQKAHAGQLTQDDYQGGTFTISNLGMTLVEEFTAIINPPQAAILAVGAVRDEVVVNPEGGFKAQKRLSLTLSCDHRVIDGLVGARFLETLVAYLENPLSLLE